MASLTAQPSKLTATARHAGGAFTPPRIRKVIDVRKAAVTRELVIAGGFGGVASLSLVGGAAWITLPSPAEATNGVAFSVEIHADDLVAGNYSEVIRATKAEWDAVDCVLTLAVRPEGPRPKR